MKSEVSCKCGKVKGVVTVVVIGKKLETVLAWELSGQFYNHPKDGIMCLSCNRGVFTKGDWQ